MEHSFPGYEVVDQLHEGESSRVYRAVYQPDRSAVVIKVFRPDAPQPAEPEYLQREYDLASTVQGEGILALCALEEHPNTVFMVARDMGGASLDRWLRRRSISVAEGLSVVLQVADALARLHAAGIVHNDLTPENIIWNPDSGQVEIADFGAAFRLTASAASQQMPELPRAQLAYVSPEHTGRIDRAVDHRSDLYNLGVTFYELLSGQRPFQSDDAMTLVHAHLAQRPAPVCDVSPEVPQVVSDIVMKLLEKDPADRYQSAQGLKADLERCRDHAAKNRDLHGLRLQLARHDPSPQLQISRKLYGREAEAAALRGAFDRACSGRVETVIISGWSGVGKTALVADFRRSIRSSTAHLASGKPDQFRRGVPYQTITQLFNDLCRDLLMEDRRVLAGWKQRICDAVGENGQILIDRRRQRASEEATAAPPSDPEAV